MVGCRKAIFNSNDPPTAHAPDSGSVPCPAPSEETSTNAYQEWQPESPARSGGWGCLLRHPKPRGIWRWEAAWLDSSKVRAHKQDLLIRILRLRIFSPLGWQPGRKILKKIVEGEQNHAISHLPCGEHLLQTPHKSPHSPKDGNNA